MYKAKDFNLGNSITLSIYGTIGGANSFEGEVVSVINGAHIPSDANGFANHSNIYGALPEEVRNVTPDRYNSYNYVMLNTGAGIVYIGIPWIRADSVQDNTTSTTEVRVIDTYNDNTRLTNVLRSNGYDVIGINTITDVGS